MTSIASLQRISAKDLSEKILAERDSSSAEPTYAIVDVRDDGKLLFLFFNMAFAKMANPKKKYATSANF